MIELLAAAVLVALYVLIFGDGGNTVCFLPIELAFTLSGRRPGVAFLGSSLMLAGVFHVVRAL